MLFAPPIDPFWRAPWGRRLAAFGLGAAIVLSRLPLQPLLGPDVPFLFSWPAIMLAAYMGGFWPALLVSLMGLGVGQYVLTAAGAPPLRPGGQAIYLAFGLLLAAGGGMRQRALRRAAEAAERLRLREAQLVNVSRLNAVGELAGTLAHEINQPLTAITSYLGAVRRLVAAPDPPVERIAELVEKATAQAVRARDIITRVRAHVSAELTPASVSLSEVVGESVAISMVSIGGAALAPEVNLDPSADAVRVDKLQIQQVLLNLLRNAAEAMEGQSRPDILIVSQAVNMEIVEVSVTDSGPGVSPKVAEQLFQPFASGKTGGMGLGLSISRGIIEAHGGKLWFDPYADRGARFRFTLPRAAAGEREARP